MEAVDEFVTPDEAAALLGVAPDRIDALVEVSVFVVHRAMRDRQ
jgi:hypothetical protein